MVTQSYKAEAIRFYDYCLTNAKCNFVFSTGVLRKNNINIILNLSDESELNIFPVRVWF